MSKQTGELETPESREGVKKVSWVAAWLKKVSWVAAW